MAGESLSMAICFVFWTMIVLVSGQQSNICNICGDGNSIQYPTGVVDFTYEGVYRKNNCVTWQKIITNNDFAIPDQFCRTEMLRYTYQVCRCTRPDGSAVEWVAPTPAPSTSAPVSMVPTRGSEIGIGAPTEIPLEWDRSAAASSSTTPTPTGVIPTFSIGATESSDDKPSSVFDAPSLSPTTATKTVDNQEVESTSGQSPLPRSDCYRIAIFCIFVVSLLLI
jgi:hypothetical protein